MLLVRFPDGNLAVGAQRTVRNDDGVRTDEMRTDHAALAPPFCFIFWQECRAQEGAKDTHIGELLAQIQDLNLEKEHLNLEKEPLVSGTRSRVCIECCFTTGSHATPSISNASRHQTLNVWQFVLCV